MACVLIVDADERAAAVLRDALADEGHSSRRAASAATAMQSLEAALFDLAIVELKLGAERGVSLLNDLAKRHPNLPVVMVTADTTVPEAIEAMRAGAADFLQKPFDRDEILYVIRKTLATSARSADQPPPSVRGIERRLIGDTDAMRKVGELVRRAGTGAATVLLRGESGTGKEVVARSIHETSHRGAKPFVKIDCTSLPDTLLESELFGYEKGAFTGAVGKKPGRVELAEGGTLFLDEIGEVSAAMQAKLLRLLQDRQFEKLGGKHPVEVDVRFVLATHRDLESMVKTGTFREDLFYRLNVFPIWLPPLRARRNDIELLAIHFCKELGAENGKPKLALAPETLRFLRAQRWPGNVRQLENFIERLVLLGDGPSISVEDAERELTQQPTFTTQSGASASASPESLPVSSALPLDAVVRGAEKGALIKALKRAGGNRSVAARVLGVSRATLYNKLKELGLDEA